MSIFSSGWVDSLEFYGRLQRSFRFQVPKVIVESEGMRYGDVLDMAIKEVEGR